MGGSPPVQATSGWWSTCLWLVCSCSYCLCPLYQSVLSATLKMFACHFTICFFRCCCKRVREIRGEVEDPVGTEASHTVLGFYCIGICTHFFFPPFSLCNWRLLFHFNALIGCRITSVEAVSEITADLRTFSLGFSKCLMKFHLFK